jgi:Protein of unknown function (DUF4231)
MAQLEEQASIVPAVHESADPTLARLEDQIAWYDRKSRQSQRRFKWLKVFEMTAAAAIPVVAAFDGPGYVLAILGALVVVTEGLLQLNQYQQIWITYRSTCEALKHEKYLFLARADVYSGSSQPLRLLAERIEGLISQEHARWVSSRRQLAEEKDSDDEERG